MQAPLFPLPHLPLQEEQALLFLSTQIAEPTCNMLLFMSDDFILLAGKRQVFPMARGFSYTTVVLYNLIFNQKK